ncbi:hypothetical protein O3M35_008499 [Rhynocoris fuscipes]|uniref:Hexosyltransferase n=1 Tax=Rhynocoris fuscipes TaxID=488301 RepID=A0AAW1DBR5_9HEMI
MQTILYHNSSGKEAFTGNLKQKEVHRAITLHPVKQYKHLYRIDNYMKMLKIQEKKHHLILLQRDILNMNQMLEKSIKEAKNEDIFADPNIFGRPPGLTKFIPANKSELIPWDFIQRSLYSAFSSNPRRRIDASLREGLDDVIREVMEMINMYSKQRGRVIDFKEIHYGYYRYNALYGADYIIDMLLMYKKYRGRKMTVPVRRHSYLQQQFSGLSLREVYEGSEVPVPSGNHLEEQSDDTVGGGSSKALKEAFESGLMKIGESLPSLLFSETETDTTLSKHNLRGKVINFILPLSGRFEIFRRFIRNFEDVCLKNEERVSLTVVLFPSAKENTVQRILDTVRGLQKLYTYARIEVVPVFENFARAKALEIGASYAREPEDLLFFIDVDMVFRSSALQRIRMNTVKGKTVYFPIVYSEFDPIIVYNKTISPNHFLINEDTGFWRQYGFGIASVYKSDLLNVGGLDTSIQGWGKEDVDLFEKFVSSNITIFRSADPDLVHVFHVVDCDPSLERTQFEMCRNTRADTYGSISRLTSIWSQNKLEGGNLVNKLRTLFYYNKTVT